MIQGESGSITKYAAVLLYDWVLQNNFTESIKLVLLVHDEINLEVHSQMQEIAKCKLEEFMKQSGKLWCQRVPLNATAVISDYWQH